MDEQIVRLRRAAQAIEDRIAELDGRQPKLAERLVADLDDLRRKIIIRRVNE